MTPGLDAKLSLAVGAWVLLPRNVDTKAGLVNGPLGTVLSMTLEHATVQFDHMNEVEMNFYVYRKQFPLILDYAVTIHKCQGLSLDCAIVDMSDEVFSPGMAYLELDHFLDCTYQHSALSRFWSLQPVWGSYRLRQTFRQDLPLYDIPSRASKRTLTGTTEHNCPQLKRRPTCTL